MFKYRGDAYRTDYVLVQDKNFKKFAKAYADDQDLFFKEYAPSLFYWKLPVTLLL